VRTILTGIPDIHFAELTSHDVVRHRLVSDIVDAYERDAALTERHSGAGRRSDRDRIARGRKGRTTPTLPADPALLEEETS